MNEQPSTDVQRTLAELVAIDSVNPDLPGGHQAAEAAVISYLEQRFEAEGIRTERRAALADRDNLIALVPGRDASRTVLLESHIDVASADGMTIPPFEPNIEGTRLYGRGACDTKGGCAAMVHALLRWHRDTTPPPCNLAFAAVVDEEYRQRGAALLAAEIDAGLPGSILKGSRIVGIVISEPTELAVVRAHKGVARFVIEVEGRMAHSSKPHLGANAIEGMARIISLIESRIGSDLGGRGTPLLGPPTHNIGLIDGGRQVNFVPDRCRIEIDRRLVPGEEQATVLDEYRQVIDEVANERPNLTIRLVPDLFFPAIETAADDALVRAVGTAAGDGNADAVESAGVPYCTDGSSYAPLGISTVVLGPGSIDQAHAAVEWVELGEVERAVEIYAEAVRHHG